MSSGTNSASAAKACESWFRLDWNSTWNASRRACTAILRCCRSGKLRARRMCISSMNLQYQGRASVVAAMLGQRAL